jgi:hypothetical protein
VGRIALVLAGEIRQGPGGIGERARGEGRQVRMAHRPMTQGDLHQGVHGLLRADQGIGTATLDAGAAVVIAQHRAGEPEIRDGQQPQLLAAGGVVALVHQPARHAGHISQLEAHRLRADAQLPLARQHHEHRLVGVPVAFITGPRRDVHQAGIQHLQAGQGKALYPEIDRQCGVVMVVQGGWFIVRPVGYGGGPAAILRGEVWCFAAADPLQQGIHAHWHQGGRIWKLIPILALLGGGASAGGGGGNPPWGEP